MKQEKPWSDSLFMLLCLLLLLFILGCSDKKECPNKTTRTLSPNEFLYEINKCEKSGGTPTPVYDKDDPMRIYRVDCK